MLSYPFSWLPAIAVVSVLVPISSYLALLVLAAMAALLLATVVGLGWLAERKLYAIAIAAQTETPADRTRTQHRGWLPA